MPKFERNKTVVDAQFATAVTNFGAFGTLNTGDALFIGANGTFNTLSCSSFHSKFTASTSQAAALEGVDFT